MAPNPASLSLFVFSYILTIATALPVASIPAGLPTGSDDAPISQQDQAGSSAASSSTSSIAYFLSSLITFPINHWTLVLCTAGPFLLLLGLAMKLKRARAMLLRREIELEIHQSMAMQIERQRASELDMEMRELAKIGIDPSRVRMIEPGVYVEAEGSDNDSYDN